MTLSLSSTWGGCPPNSFISTISKQRCLNSNGWSKRIRQARMSFPARRSVVQGVRARYSSFWAGRGSPQACPQSSPTKIASLSKRISFLNTQSRSCSLPSGALPHSWLVFGAACIVISAPLWYKALLTPANHDSQKSCFPPHFRGKDSKTKVSRKHDKGVSITKFSLLMDLPNCHRQLVLKKIKSTR